MTRKFLSGSALRCEKGKAHTFNIEELNVHISMLPGMPSVALFKASVPGIFIFYCDVPGHRQAGMVGTFIVEP